MGEVVENGLKEEEKEEEVELDLDLSIGLGSSRSRSEKTEKLKYFSGDGETESSIMEAKKKKREIQALSSEEEENEQRACKKERKNLDLNQNGFVFKSCSYSPSPPLRSPAGGPMQYQLEYVPVVGNMNGFQPMACGSFRPFNQDINININNPGIINLSGDKINGCKYNGSKKTVSNTGSSVHASSDNQTSSHEGSPSSETRSRSSQSSAIKTGLIKEEHVNPLNEPVTKMAGKATGKPPKPEIQNQNNAAICLPLMPCVTTTGNGPNGRTITGFLYRYSKSEVTIVCVCHGNAFSPAGFVQHAGGTEVSHPLRHITVIPCSLA